LNNKESNALIKDDKVLELSKKLFEQDKIIRKLREERDKLKKIVGEMKTCPMMLCYNCQQDCPANELFEKSWEKN
jgi:hypothetical protein